MRDGTNTRTDEYGGSIPNRCRLLLECLDEMISVFGPNRTGIKLSPICDYNDMHDSDPFATLEYLLPELNKRNLAYVQVNEALTFDPNTYMEKFMKFYGNIEKKSIRENFRHKFNGAWITNGGLDYE